MAICRFYQSGSCRFGNQCKNEHPGAGRPTDNPFYSTGNRFASLQSGSGHQSNGPAASTAAGKPAFGITKESIVLDLRNERPPWILSAYGPGSQAPAQLIGGPEREQSFEEMRLLHYVGIASGNSATAAQQYDAMVQAAEQQIQTILSDVDGAMEFILRAQSEHPNRIDNCNNTPSQVTPSKPFSNNQGSDSVQAPFQAAAQQSASPFGQLSALSQRPNPFAAAVSQTKAEAFGRPSLSGMLPNSINGTQPTLSAFGQTSTFGAKPNPFGTSTAGTGAFGQPSALGVKPNPFATATIPSSAFGQPSVMGANTSPFAAVQATNISAFGQASTVGVKPNPFASAGGAENGTGIGFGSLTGGVSPFTAASDQAIRPNPFGGVTSKTSPFAQASNSTTDTFGSQPAPQPAPFGAPAEFKPNPFAPSSQSSLVTSNPFLAANQTSTTSRASEAQHGQANPFLQSTSGAAANPFQKSASTEVNAGSRPNPFAQAAVQAGSAAPVPSPAPLKANGSSTGNNNPYPPGSELSHPLLSSYATVRGRELVAFKGNRVQYKGVMPMMQHRDGGSERVWFPEGPPAFNKDTAISPDSGVYDGPNGAQLEAEYRHVMETGVFKNGMMPLMPPKREWCLWDF